MKTLREYVNLVENVIPESNTGIKVYIIAVHDNIELVTRDLDEAIRYIDSDELLSNWVRNSGGGDHMELIQTFTV